MDPVARTRSTAPRRVDRHDRLPSADPGHVGASANASDVEPDPWPSYAERPQPSAQHVNADLEGMGIALGDLLELRDLTVALQELPCFRPTWLELLNAAITFRGPRTEHAVGPAQPGRICQPSCLIWGQHDPFGPVSVGQTAARLIPRAELHVLTGGRPPGILPSADAAAPLVQRFLDAHYGPSASPATAAAQT